MQIENFVDGEGKIKSEKIQTDIGIEIIKMHVDTSDTENTKYFVDDNGEKGAAEIVGEAGKIYIDLESGYKVIYTFNGEILSPSLQQSPLIQILKIFSTNRKIFAERR